MKWSTNRCFYRCIYNLSESCCIHQIHNFALFAIDPSKRISKLSHCVLFTFHTTAELYFEEVCTSGRRRRRSFSSSTQNAFIYFIFSDCFIFSVDIIGLFISDLSGMFDKDVSFGIITSTAEEKLHFRRRRLNFEVLVLHLSISILLYYYTLDLHSTACV